MQLLAIALGGALGSVFRFLASKGVQTLFGLNFPYGIIAVNIVGSFLMGLLATLLFERFSIGISPLWTPVLLIGFLGGFTTFSSFSIDTLNLLENGAIFQALLYVTASVGFGLLAAWFGVLLARG